jgi:hypothetical protein
MSDTPRTDYYTKRLRSFCDDEYVPIEFARQLERELAAVTKERDRLAEALRELCETLLKDKTRDITELLNKAGDALAAAKL